MNKSYLGLGTNMGDRDKYLSDACELLNNHEKINITKKSKIWLGWVMQLRLPHYI